MKTSGRRLPLPTLPLAVTLCGFALSFLWPMVRSRLGLGMDGAFDGAVTLLAGSAGWFGLAWFGTRVVDGLLRRPAASDRSPAAPRLVGDLTRVLFFGLAGLAVASFVLRLPVTGLIATSGVVIAVLGFALRNILADIFSGIAINVEHPYRIGDWIQVGAASGGPGATGKVVEVNWRSTRLLTTDGTTVILPNGLIAGSRFVNYSLPDASYRASLRVHLDPAVPVRRARRVLLSALLSVDHLLAEGQSDVVVDSVGEAGVCYLLRFRVPDHGAEVACRDAVAAAVLKALRDAGLAVSAPRRSLVPQNRAGRDLEGMDICRRMLGAIPLFQAFTTAELDALASRMKRRQFASGAVVVNQGDQGSSLFLVTEGLLEVRGTVMGGDGSRPVVLDRMAPGAIFGEMALLTGEPRSATVEALTDAVVYELAGEHLRPLLHDRAELAERLSELMAERAEHNAEKRATALRPMPVAPAPHRRDLLDRLRDFFGLPAP
ncbi:mechanosensitive ion channel family protein [Skermanella pratensis]|uniref:mechanosensitive ion channel family protein n=1 Tax=Skermanella pratensis TaxID=2233999 RepID=UPI0013018F55|nr:mechanosensitive ion channel family protein [Skermanella pratensis]